MTVIKEWNGSAWVPIVVGKQGPPGLDGIGSEYYGQVWSQTPGSITVGTQGVYQSTGLTAALDPDTQGVALGTTDSFAIKNVDGQTRRAQIIATYDATVSGPATTLGLILALNGVTIAETECRATTSATGAISKLHTTWIIDLLDDDEVALFVANHSSTTAISFQRGRIVVNGVTGYGPAGPTGPTGAPGVVAYDDVDNILAHQVFS
jgi:hypothetical protein